jgi:23S rRNA pseudouridine1911/1915/1917 synthase
MKEIKLTATEDVNGLRVDKAVSELCDDLTRSGVQTLLEEKRVLLNGKVAKKSESVKSGDILEIEIPDPKTLSLEPQNIPLEIPFEDEHLLVVNKPKGMVVHPAAGNFDKTLVNALLYHCGDSLSGINGVIRPGIVHRIDKDTSGLLVVAKTDQAHVGLAEQIKDHSFKREYRTVIVGNIKDDTGTINLPIGRHPVDRKKQTVTNKNSREAITHYEVLERFNGFTFLRVMLETGRTHQIRVHFSHRGTPVAGDAVYGNLKKTYGLEGQCLHAAVLGFIHPITQEYLEFSSDLPDYFKEFLRRIK